MKCSFVYNGYSSKALHRLLRKFLENLPFDYEIFLSHAFVKTPSRFTCV